MVFCYYNMKLAFRDRQAEANCVDKYDPLDMFENFIGDAEVEETNCISGSDPSI